MIEAPPRLLGEDARRSRVTQAAVLGAAVGLLALASPARPLPFEVCAFHLITGLPCPTCGMTRALCQALHGDWVRSVASHPAGLIVAAWLVGWMVWSAAEAYRGRMLLEPLRSRLANLLLAAGITVAAAFWVAQLIGRI